MKCDRPAEGNSRTSENRLAPGARRLNNGTPGSNWGTNALVSRVSLLLLLSVLLAGFNTNTVHGQGRNLETWERSLVVIDVTRKHYDYMQPWGKRTRSAQKTGIFLGNGQILTTADELQDRTLIRLQKQGRGVWYAGEVSWIDYHANLALITSRDEKFWEGLRGARLSDEKGPSENLQVIRWRGGNLEVRKAEFNQFTVDESQLSFVPQLQMEISSEIQGLAGSEPVIVGNEVVGLNITRGGGTLRVVPSSFITPILKLQQRNEFKGLGYFDFVWQPAENPDILKFLKLPGEQRGVVVISVPTNREPVLKPKDLILKVEGFPIDTQGDYKDPQFGHLSLENLASRGKSAGDPVKISIRRNGQEQEVTYILPKADFSTRLLDAEFDTEPEYLIAGGLVFQPLNIPFLKTWGDDWERRAPFRLSYFRNELSTPERPGLVLLSNVLPDRYNLGYQDNRFLVVKSINGRKVHRLDEVEEALKSHQQGYHQIEFIKGDGLQRMVLSAADLDSATQRILRQYGIPNRVQINKQN